MLLEDGKGQRDTFALGINTVCCWPPIIIFECNVEVTHNALKKCPAAHQHLNANKQS